MMLAHVEAARSLKIATESKLKLNRYLKRFSKEDRFFVGRCLGVPLRVGLFAATPRPPIVGLWGFRCHPSPKRQD
jgi:hypothetical protein